MLSGMAQLVMLELSSHSPSQIRVRYAALLRCNRSKGSWWKKHRERMGKEEEGKVCAGRQLSIKWKGGLIREKAFEAGQVWQNMKMPLFISPLLNLVSFWRHVSTLWLAKEREEIVLCFPFRLHHPPAEQLLLIIVALTPVSSPISWPKQHKGAAASPPPANALMIPTPA